jgi:putative oxidoreductase
MKKADIGYLVLRLALGAVFVMHGLNKIWPAKFPGPSTGIPDFATALAGMGVPIPDIMAYVVAATELGGGALVILGLFPQIAALGLLGVMVVAIAKVQFKNGFFLPGGYEFAMMLGGAALTIVIGGAGEFSLGSMLKSRGKKKG